MAVARRPRRCVIARRIPVVAPPAREPDCRCEPTATMYLQLAAFSNLDNAENFLAVIEFQLSGRELQSQRNSLHSSYQGAR